MKTNGKRERENERANPRWWCALADRLFVTPTPAIQGSSNLNIRKLLFPPSRRLKDAISKIIRLIIDDLSILARLLVKILLTRTELAGVRG